MTNLQGSVYELKEMSVNGIRQFFLSISEKAKVVSIVDTVDSNR